MKFGYLLLVCCIMAMSANPLAAQSQYSKVKIFLDGRSERELEGLGIETDHGVFKKGYFLITDLSSVELQSVKNANFRTEVVIADVQQFYRTQNEQLNAARQGNGDGCDLPEYDVPQGFHLGSYAGYFTYQEMLDMLDSMYARFPNLITKYEAIDSSLTTIEGRYVYWLKISDNPAVDESEPEMLYDAVHHAREPGSMSQLIFYMWYLLENYQTDAGIQHLVDNTELYFVPCINPDGYLYNESTDPAGGGMWRKNRRDNLDGTFGVDINRNYGYEWAYDNQGSSPDPQDETYRGTTAFSEPETQLIKQFCEDHEFRIALNHHAYGGFVVIPWGFEADYLTPDSTFFDKLGAHITEENNYIYGTGDMTVGYTTNGDSDDWMYGEQVTKDKIFSMTPESGSAFWEPSSRIIQICKDNLAENLNAARALLDYGVLTDLNPRIADNDTGYLVFDITRLGLLDTDTFTVAVAAITPGLSVPVTPATFVNMALAETLIDSFYYTLDTAANPGIAFQYTLTVGAGGISYTDTITRYYGDFTIAFDEPGTNLSQWTTTTWGISNTDFYSSPSSMADSPLGFYNPTEQATITTEEDIDLTHALQAFLVFRAKWDIETSFDYAQLQVSAAGGAWEPVCGKYTHNGGFYQDFQKPIYDGTQEEWVLETIDLQQYVGTEIKLRFRLTSDDFVEGDGFNFDDLQVKVIGDTCFAFTSAINSPLANTIEQGDSLTLNAVVVSGAEYQWERNGVPIPNAEDSVYEVTLAGTYTVITTYGACSKESEAVEVTVITGIDEAAAEIASIYPNPFTGLLNIERLNVAASCRLTVTDVTGRVVEETIIPAGTKVYELDMSGTTSGIYLLNLSTSAATKTYKLVKQ